MKKNRCISFVLSVLFLVSCSSKSEKLGSSDEAISGTENIDFESIIEKRIAETDLNEQLEITNSLFYTKEDGSSYEVKAFLDKSDAVLKVEEKFVNGATNEYGTTIYYVHNGKKYASKERFEDRKLKKPMFVERISFYNEKEKVVSTKMRKAFFEEDLDSKSLENADLYDCSIINAMNALNQEGQFETRFQGFALNGNTNYVIVGESAENGYVSTLLIQYEDQTIRELMRNQKKMVGTKLDLQYQKMIDETGFEYQVLLSLKIAK